MPLTCVLFDLDDTLLPTFARRAAAFERAAQAVLGRNLDGAAMLREMAGRTIEDTADELTGSDAARAAELVRVYRETYFSANGHVLMPFPGISETLERLRATGVRVGVVTSKIHWGAEDELRRAGILPYIEHIVGADDVTRHKPAPAPVLQALDALRAAPRSAVMVGDTAADILAAHAAGVPSGAALWGTQDRETLLAVEPTYLLEQVGDVLKLT